LNPARTERVASLGKSTASLHLLLPPAQPVATLRLPALRRTDPQAVVGRAYAKLGWAVAASPDSATRGAILTPAAPGEYVSIYDSAQDGSAETTLRSLAALLSKTMATTAIVTLSQADERFLFIIYRLGRQIDAAMTETDRSAEGLTCVRGRQQAHLWYEALGHHRFMALTEPAQDAPARIARFVAMAGQAAAAANDTAHAALAAWCRLAGVPVAAALNGYEDAARLPGLSHLALTAAPGSRRAAARSATRALTPIFAPEDYPYQAFFPAAWPVAEAATTQFIWPVALQSGLSSLRVALHLDRTGDVRLEKITVSAFTTMKGEVVSATPLASWGQTVPEDIGSIEGDLAFDADLLPLPEPETPGAAYLLQIRADIVTGDSGEAFITPSLRAESISAAPLMLPTLRLRVTPRIWLPKGAPAQDMTPVRLDALLRLNAPAVHNAVALLADTGDDVRASVRAFMERVLAPVTATRLVATIETQKYLSGDFSVPKSRQTVPLHSLLQTPAWARLFETERQFQSVRIGIGLQDGPAPLAGMVLQTSLRNERGEDVGQTRFSGPSLAAAFWMLAEDGALDLLRLNLRDARDHFASWVGASAPLQAWAAECAWIPEFDYHDKFVMTPYESAGPVDWFGENLVGTLMDRAWLCRHLRFVAPRLWLGWELAERVNATQLTGFAHVTQYDDGIEIVLRDPRHLPLLEHRLAAILPGVPQGLGV